jgi:hypothetical protein
VDPLIPLLGILFGWLLRSLADFFVYRHKDSRAYNSATFFLIRAWKLLKDYERGMAYFRSKRPAIEDFEPWRAILAKRFLENYTANTSTIAEAVRLLAEADPVLAARLDNTFRNVELTFHAHWEEIASSDPERYAKLIYKQDDLVDIALDEMENVALKLSARSGAIKRYKAGRYFKSVKVGTSEFNAGLDESSELLRKVVGP